MKKFWIHFWIRTRRSWNRWTVYFFPVSFYRANRPIFADTYKYLITTVVEISFFFPPLGFSNFVKLIYFLFILGTWNVAWKFREFFHIYEKSKSIILRQFYLKLKTFAYQFKWNFFCFSYFILLLFRVRLDETHSCLDIVFVS